MEHLRKFELETDYLKAKNGFYYPNVSYVAEKDILHYMEKPKYEFVDLGLPSGLKWAACNIGATKPEESGFYFSWGENKRYIVTPGEVRNEKDGHYTAVIKNAYGNETTNTFAEDDYKYYDVATSTYTKYNATDGLTKLKNEDDGCYLTENSMRMPNRFECEELIENTTSAWTENYNGSGINGVTLTSKKDGNSNSIFIPAVGSVQAGVLLYFGIFGNFWTSSLFTSVHGAYNLCFNLGPLYVDWTSRYYGMPIRAVRK